MQSVKLIAFQTISLWWLLNSAKSYILLYYRYQSTSEDTYATTLFKDLKNSCSEALDFILRGKTAQSVRRKAESKERSKTR